MAGKIFLRLVGTLTCMAVVAIAWDAEACGHRHHRRACCAPVCCDPCYSAPACCEPARCAPVCETACAPSCCYRPACGYTVVRESVILPSACCTIASTAAPTASVASSPAKPAVKTVASSR
jgi:hypothetical protein